MLCLKYPTWWLMSVCSDRTSKLLTLPDNLCQWSVLPKPQNVLLVVGTGKSAVNWPIFSCTPSLKMYIHTHTSLAGAGPVPSASTVADEAIPAFFADPSVLAWVALALFARLLRARGLDASTILCLGNLTDVLASTINEKVTDTANVTVVEHSRPQLSGQDEVGAVSREAP